MGRPFRLDPPGASRPAHAPPERRALRRDFSQSLAVRVVKTALYLRVSDPDKGQTTDNQLVREQSKRTVPVPIPDLDRLCTLTL